MSLEWLQKPWIYILKDSTLLVICRAIASDSAPPGSGIFWWHLLVLGPHSDSHKMCQRHRGLPSTLAGLLLVSWDRGGAMHVQNEKTGQPLQLLSQQVSSASWIFYGPEGIPQLLRFGLWSLSKSSHPPPFIFQSTQPVKQQPGDGSPIPIHETLWLLLSIPLALFLLFQWEEDQVYITFPG